jgi:hypothetical protein
MWLQCERLTRLSILLQDWMRSGLHFYEITMWPHIVARKGISVNEEDAKEGRPRAENTNHQNQG